MEKSNKISSKFDYAELVDSLNELTAALAKHSGYLKQHNATMENLALAVDRLDSTLRKEIRLETSRQSLQLKQVITEFVESYIKPQFYQTPSYALLTGTPKITRVSLPTGQRPCSTN
jgi:hypothetical protein